MLYVVTWETTLFFYAKAVFSRVARVCKSDRGGPHRFSTRWSSFLKARLNCSVPGEVPFAFDELQATTGFVDSGVGGDDRVVYGVFTTGDNAIAGSAVCAFSVDDMRRAFEEGPFKNQETIYSNWLPTSRSQVPRPRPGMCSNSSSFSLPETHLNFIRHHPLVDWAVGGTTRSPVFVRTAREERLTVIEVDPKVSRDVETEIWIESGVAAAVAAAVASDKDDDDYNKGCRDSEYVDRCR